MAHNLLVSWTVELADEFEPEYENLPNEALRAAVKTTHTQTR